MEILNQNPAFADTFVYGTNILNTNALKFNSIFFYKILPKLKSNQTLILLKDETIIPLLHPLLLKGS